MARRRRVAGWGHGILFVSLACASTTATGERHATDPPGEPKPPIAEPASPAAAGISNVVAASAPTSSFSAAQYYAYVVLKRRWFHELCVRPPPEPRPVTVKPEEPKKPTALGARLDALGSPPEVPRPEAPVKNPWYAPQCEFIGIPVSIDYQDGPDPLTLACREQRAACEKRMDEAALRRVPTRAEVEIDTRGEAHGVTIYQNGRKLDDGDLEEAVLCLFRMLPGDVAWNWNRCPGS